MVFESILDPIFRPLLNLNPFVGILIISFIITLIINLVYKFATDQKMMKNLKTELKDLQKQMKKLTNDPKKAMEVQKKLMEKNMEYMKHSFRPTLFTFLPIIIIFGWLNANMAYYPLMPSEEFDVTVTMKDNLIGEVSLKSIPELQINPSENQEIQNDQATWTVSGDEGKYTLFANYGGREEVAKEVLITENREYIAPEELYKGDIKKINVGNRKIKPFGESFSLFGWQPGWLGTYIILSIALSTLMRRAMRLS